MRAMRVTRGWIPHLVCLGVLAGQLAVFALVHVSDAEVERAIAEGTVEERLEALHIAMNRGEPDARRFDESFVRGLLAEPDDRLKELAFSIDVCKFEKPTLQTRYVKEPRGDIPHWWRSYVIHRRKAGGNVVGGGGGITREELRWYQDALHEFAPPMQELIAHLRRISDQSRRRQAELGLTPD